MYNNNGPTKSKMQNVCGVWKKISKKSGKAFLAGFDLKAIQQVNPETHELLMFTGKKTDKYGNPNDKLPDYQLVAVEKMQQRQQPQQRQQYAPPSREDDSDMGF